MGVPEIPLASYAPDRRGEISADSSTHRVNKIPALRSAHAAGKKAEPTVWGHPKIQRLFLVPWTNPV